MNPPLPLAEARSAAATTAVIQMVEGAVGTFGATGSPSVEGINWSISAGDYWVVGGLPGSGKTDLLATMAGLYRPIRGTLRLFGSDIAELAEEDFLAARMRIGLVFENGGRMFNHLTVADNVALPLRYHHNGPLAETDGRVNKILEATGLIDLAAHTPGQIKHACRQRVGLARALSVHPEVLLLDNPLAGLGQQETRWWREFLARLAAGHDLMEGRPATLVVACHDLRPWADQGEQFALLKQKRWLPVGGRAKLTCSDEPLLRELLAADFGGGQPVG